MMCEKARWWAQLQPSKRQTSDRRIVSSVSRVQSILNAKPILQKSTVDN